jgi:hypothetical protein
MSVRQWGDGTICILTTMNTCIVASREGGNELVERHTYVPIAMREVKTYMKFEIELQQYRQTGPNAV